MRSIFFLLLVILCHGCKSQEAGRTGINLIKYDCELVSAEFDEREYMSSPLTKPAYRKFKNSINEGVFFTRAYFNNSTSSKAIVLDFKTKELRSYTVGDSTSSFLSGEKIGPFEKIISKVEKGTF